MSTTGTTSVYALLRYADGSIEETPVGAYTIQVDSSIQLHYEAPEAPYMDVEHVTLYKTIDGIDLTTFSLSFSPTWQSQCASLDGGFLITLGG